MAGTSGSGLVTCSYGEAKSSAARIWTRSSPAKDSAAPTAIPRQRGDGSRPSGKIRTIAANGAKSSGHALAREHRPAPARKRTGVLQHGVLGIRLRDTEQGNGKPLANSSQPIGWPRRRVATSRPNPTDTNVAALHAIPLAGPDPRPDSASSTPAATSMSEMPAATIHGRISDDHLRARGCDKRATT